MKIYVKTNSRSIGLKIRSSLHPSIKCILIYLIRSNFTGLVVKTVTRPFKKLTKFDYSLVDRKTAAEIFFGIWESTEIRYSKKYV